MPCPIKGTGSWVKKRGELGGGDEQQDIIGWEVRVLASFWHPQVTVVTDVTSNPQEQKSQDY